MTSSANATDTITVASRCSSTTLRAPGTGAGAAPAEARHGALVPEEEGDQGEGKRR